MTSFLSNLPETNLLKRLDYFFGREWFNFIHFKNLNTDFDFLDAHKF